MHNVAIYTHSPSNILKKKRTLYRARRFALTFLNPCPYRIGDNLPHIKSMQLTTIYFIQKSARCRIARTVYLLLQKFVCGVRVMPAAVAKFAYCLFNARKEPIIHSHVQHCGRTREETTKRLNCAATALRRTAQHSITSRMHVHKSLNKFCIHYFY